LEELSLSASDGVRSLSPTSDDLFSSFEGSGGVITAFEILDLIVDTTLSLDTLSQVLHKLHEPVNLIPEEVVQFIGALMCAMDIITTTSLMAECVSWDNTGEVRNSMALSCHQLLSSICPEGAYLTGTASGQCLEAETASSYPPISEGASTLDRGEKVISSFLDTSSGASKPLTATQAH